MIPRMFCSNKLVVIFLVSLFVNSHGGSVPNNNQVDSTLKVARKKINLSLSKNGELNLSNRNLTGNDLCAVNEYLLEQTPNVNAVDLSNNNFSGVHEINSLINVLRFTEVSVLILRNTSIGDKELETITNELSRNNLYMIDLSENKFDELKLIRFIEELEFSKIDELYLDNCNFTMTMSFYLAMTLNKKNISKISLKDNLLEALNLDYLLTAFIDKGINFAIDGNKLGDDGVGLMLSVLKANNKTDFKLPRNNVTAKGCLIIAEASKDFHLASIDLSDNDLGLLGVNLIVDVIRRRKIYAYKLKNIDRNGTSFFDSFGKIKFPQKYHNTSFIDLDYLDDFSPVEASVFQGIVNWMNVKCMKLKFTKPFSNNSFATLERLNGTQIEHLILQFDYNIGEPEERLFNDLPKLNLKKLTINVETFNLKKLVENLSPSKLEFLDLSTSITDFDGVDMLSYALKDTSLKGLRLKVLDYKPAFWDPDDGQLLEDLMIGVSQSNIKQLEVLLCDMDEITPLLLSSVSKYLRGSKISSMFLRVHIFTVETELNSFSPDKQGFVMSVSNKSGWKNLTEFLSKTRIRELGFRRDFLNTNEFKVLIK